MRSRRTNVNTGTRNAEFLTNTQYERLALRRGINLSDGHAKLPFDEVQYAIFSSTSRHVDRSATMSQSGMESAFARSFFKLAGQRFDLDTDDVYFSYSASSGIKIAAQILHARGMRVLIIDPCFDNIRGILLSFGVELDIVEECELDSPSQLHSRLDDRTALWLVLPNNPTGFCVSRSAFLEIVEICKSKGSTILVDLCFRFYSPTMRSWDQYEILDDAGVDYITFEDSGKTWSALDLKVGMMRCSRVYRDRIAELHDLLLLNVSPYQLSVLWDLVEDSALRGLDRTVLDYVANNRRTVHQLNDLIENSHIFPGCNNVPMEIVGLPSGISSRWLWHEARDMNIDILPAHNYFYRSAERGDQMFRVPLARPMDEIENAVDILATLIGRLRNQC